MKKSLYIDEMSKKKNKQTAVLPIEEEEKEDVFVSTLRSEKRESENSAEEGKRQQEERWRVF